MIRRCYFWERKFIRGAEIDQMREFIYIKSGLSVYSDKRKLRIEGHIYMEIVDGRGLK